MTDPYRTNLLTRINEISDLVSENTESIKTIQRTNEQTRQELYKAIQRVEFVPSIWGTIKSAFRDFVHWHGWGFSFIVFVVLFASGAGIHSCVKQNEREEHQTYQRYRQACNALHMRFVDTSNQSGSERFSSTQSIVCVGDNKVISIDINSPNRTYIRNLTNNHRTRSTAH